MADVYPKLTDIFVRIADGHAEDREAVGDSYLRWFDEIAPESEGWLGATAGISDDGEFVSIMRFVSREAARRDLADEESWWKELSGHLSDAEVLESAEVATFGEKRPDAEEVGFVQVVRARASAIPEVLERVAEHEEHHLREQDLPVLGGLVAHHGDDHFTEVIYYPSVEGARGEAGELPEEGISIVERIAGHLTGARYLRIRDPWVHRH